MFTHTADYDNAIAGYLTPWQDTLPARVTLSMERRQVLRYGENPQQRAGLYVTEEPRGIGDLTQRQGKELSFNNLLDIDAAMMAVAAWTNRVACAVIKHTTPCGIALGRSAAEAFERRPRDRPGLGVRLGHRVQHRGRSRRRRGDGRPLRRGGRGAGVPRRRAGALRRARRTCASSSCRWSRGQAGLDWKKIRGGFLIQDRFAFDRSTRKPGASRRSASRPTAELNDLRFAWAAVSMVKSNAIVLARDEQAIGIGAGQMSRVDAVVPRGAQGPAGGPPTAGAVLASDGFFPFPDGVEEAAAAGVRAIIQPGGSVRDAEVIAAANRLGHGDGDDRRPDVQALGRMSSTRSSHCKTTSDNRPPYLWAVADLRWSSSSIYLADALAHDGVLGHVGVHRGRQGARHSAPARQSALHAAGARLGLLPLAANYAKRINLFAAFTSAAGAGFWFLVAERWLRNILPARRPRLAAAFAGIFASAMAWTVWNQSTVNEKVYTVSLLSIAMVVWCMVRWADLPDSPAAQRHC